MDYPNQADIQVKDVIYEKNDKGLVDIVHGKYQVHVHSADIASELIMTFYKCPSGSKDLCKDNPREISEKMDCKRFLSDKSGPWYMFAPAMDPANVCARIMGEYEFKGAHLNEKFVENYMTVEEGHFRIRMLNHVQGKDMDIKNLRGCVELDFDILS